MSDLDRRQFLKRVLGSLAQGAGAVVLASSVTRARADDRSTSQNGADVQKRADRVSESLQDGVVDDGTPVEASQFLNRPGWVNGGWPNGWLNGGWPNGWRNTGWPNGWRNGGWRNTGWRNGNWRNGGWLNGGWRNR